ncbi:hypothetical protein IU414_06700 [Nocardia farcinica]|uniref:hypothetical protein n=1 Tax=Nocardia farcinica TaxID=37329 RepID=UPI00189351A1|nr:hypothetical protein [Nocardia farcinica]MBF6584448.1 hypothetical protein [Nocardia farcinica]
MTQIADLARQITDRTDIDYDAALTLATTYAVQCGYTDLPEGGQAPHAEVSAEDAAFILEAAGVAAEIEPPTLLDEIADAAAAIKTASARRDEAIRKAITNGVAVSKIAEAAELSRERVYQIRDRRR